MWGSQGFNPREAPKAKHTAGGSQSFNPREAPEAKHSAVFFLLFQSARSFRGETFSVGLSRFQFARSSRGETFSVGALKVSIREKLLRRNIQRGTPKANLERGSSKAKPSARRNILLLVGIRTRTWWSAGCDEDPDLQNEPNGQCYDSLTLFYLFSDIYNNEGDRPAGR